MLQENQVLPEHPTDYRDNESDQEGLDTVVASEEYWGAVNPPPNLHVSMKKDLLDAFVKGYQEDPAFRHIWDDPKSEPNGWTPGHRFFKDDSGLLYFRDSDYQPRLCVPKSQRAWILTEAHESPLTSAHAGPEKLWQKLSQKFYWKRMKADLLVFCRSCDVCQKIKNSNFNRYGFLIPNPIPSKPYESISMDLVVNLPLSEGYNAVYVVVDRLTKHAQFIPTTTGISSEDFAYLFTKKVVSKFGLPESVITDRDPRWTSDFWRAVSSFL